MHAPCRRQDSEYKYPRHRPEVDHHESRRRWRPVNKMETAVRIKHVPTGIELCCEHRAVLS